MTGPEHYGAAEDLLARAAGDTTSGEDYTGDELAAAQVHATLALAAATARPAVRNYWGDEDTTDREWAGVTS